MLLKASEDSWALLLVALLVTTEATRLVMACWVLLPELLLDLCSKTRSRANSMDMGITVITADGSCQS
jgi:hypothetical protein